MTSYLNEPKPKEYFLKTIDFCLLLKQYIAKEPLKKQKKQLVIRLVIKPLINLRKSQELHHRIVQRQLKVKLKIEDLIKKYQKKDIYLQKKDRK